MFDKFSHLRKLHVSFKTAPQAERSAARRALLAEAVRLDLTVVALSDALQLAAPECAN